MLAAQLDQDPFLLFELRGLSREALQKELVKSPLGQALSAELASEKTAPDSESTYYTRPTLQSPVAVASLKDFWHGAKRLPQVIEAASQASVPAILVKKQGDFPPFWPKEHSFVETMEELYGRIRTKNTNLF